MSFQPNFASNFTTAKLVNNEAGTWTVTVEFKHLLLPTTSFHCNVYLMLLLIMVFVSCIHHVFEVLEAGILVTPLFVSQCPAWDLPQSQVLSVFAIINLKVLHWAIHLPASPGPSQVHNPTVLSLSVCSIPPPLSPLGFCSEWFPLSSHRKLMTRACWCTGPHG